MRVHPATFVLLGTMALILSAPASPSAARAAAARAAGIREDIPGRDRARYRRGRTSSCRPTAGCRTGRPTSAIRDSDSPSRRRSRTGTAPGSAATSGTTPAGSSPPPSPSEPGSTTEYPEPVYYPVMNALKAGEIREAIGHTTLAATKIAHEFGHLGRMIATDAALYRLQTELIPWYNTIIREQRLERARPAAPGSGPAHGRHARRDLGGSGILGRSQRDAVLCATASRTARSSARCSPRSSGTWTPMPRSTATGSRRSRARRCR